MTFVDGLSKLASLSAIAVVPLVGDRPVGPHPVPIAKWCERRLSASKCDFCTVAGPRGGSVGVHASCKFLCLPDPLLTLNMMPRTPPATRISPLRQGTECHRHVLGEKAFAPRPAGRIYPQAPHTRTATKCPCNTPQSACRGSPHITACCIKHPADQSRTPTRLLGLSHHLRTVAPHDACDPRRSADSSVPSATAANPSSTSRMPASVVPDQSRRSCARRSATWRVHASTPLSCSSSSSH